MPRSRKTTTERGKWSSEELRAAIRTVEAGIPIRQAATVTLLNVYVRPYEKSYFNI